MLTWFSWARRNHWWRVHFKGPQARKVGDQLTKACGVQVPDFNGPFWSTPRLASSPLLEMETSFQFLLERCHKFSKQAVKGGPEPAGTDCSMRIHSPFTQTLEGSTLRISVHDCFNIWRMRKKKKMKWVHYCLQAKNKYIKSWPLSALSSLENRLGCNTWEMSRSWSWPAG